MVDTNCQTELKEARETIQQLQQQLCAVQEELKMTNSELMQLTLEMDTRVAERTRELKEMNQQLQSEIEQRKQMEKQRKIFADDLQRSNKELEQFAYVASHDLQEPLRKISNFTELFVKRYPDLVDEKAQKYVAYILDGAKRMQQLIHDLLEYSRAGRMNVEQQEIDCNILAEQIKKDLSKLITKHKVKVEIGPLPVVWMNRTGLYQVLQNLISNAIKFNHAEKPWVRLSATKEAREWIFRVEDNGIGIESKYAERIFIIFQRLHTREEYTGTGIGLSVCKKIIKQRGGRIWFESQPGQGTKFFFTIPDVQKENTTLEGKDNE
ncbi:GHKL domain-containing protein [bacterium]|nr:GHKL domain-containing protein [bacterium]